MAAISSRVLRVCLLAVLVELAESQICRKIDQCSCVLDNGDEINLHLSSGADDGKPVFRFHSGPFVYTYSPCSGFSCGLLSLNDTAICKGPPDMPIANVSSAAFEVDKSDISLLYRWTGKMMTSHVKLECSDAETFALVGFNSSTYNFTLQTLCACPGACVDSALNMSVGTVLILIFLSMTTAYFGTGCVYRKALYGASGLELLPHRHFWCSLPPLIKDGYMFFISPCLGNRAEYRTYDRL
ncbi:hypothetical protein BaRGS_00017151 [Batillaria attramentaria]|uniref:Uncharacterized protein n=1 Tax=Batillaria attramentaria TaxID=370345 RepID=A0ABD0KX04_9CAEN